jgi:hypothetical protein
LLPDEKGEDDREVKKAAQRLRPVADSPHGKEVLALSEEMREGNLTAEDAVTAVATLLREFEKKFESTQSS